MNGYFKSVKIDPEELKAWVKETGKTQSEISISLGRARNCLANAIYYGEMSATVFELLTLKYGVDPKRLMKKPEPPKAQPKPVAKPDAIGYATNINVYPDKVRFAIAFNGVEILHAYSKVKGNKEVDLIQAISYAAHMCYKLAEQGTLDEE